MKNLFKIYLIGAIVIFLAIACKKDVPITDLGDSNGGYYPMLNVSYNISKPVFGDTVVVTASTWQRDDKIAKVEFTETAVEVFGLDFILNKGTAVNTYDVDDKISLLVITDTVLNEALWFEVSNADNQLNQYFVTISNNYIIRGFYPFEQKEGQYANGVEVIDDLSDNEFEIIKSLLAYRINQADYKNIFPSAPSSHLSNGTYALTEEGMLNLREHLTRTLLIQNMSSCKKVGTYTAKVITSVTTPAGAVKSLNNSFQAIL